MIVWQNEFLVSNFPNTKSRSQALEKRHHCFYPHSLMVFAQQTVVKAQEGEAADKSRPHRLRTSEDDAASLLAGLSSLAFLSVVAEYHAVVRILTVLSTYHRLNTEPGNFSSREASPSSAHERPLLRSRRPAFRGRLRWPLSCLTRDSSEPTVS